MKKKVASIMRYKGDKERAIKWLHSLPVKYNEYILDRALPGCYLMWTVEYGLQITF